MLLYVENLKDGTKNMLELTNTTKLQNKKINAQKLVAFLYTTTYYSKRKLKNNSIYNSIKKNEMFSYKVNQEGALKTIKY